MGEPHLPMTLVGVDLGGTKIAAALVSASGDLLGEIQQIPTPARQGSAAILKAIADLVAKVARRHDAHPSAVGIGAAGVIDTEQGLVISATDALPGWTGTRIAAGVSQLLREVAVYAPDGQAPLVYVDNDVNAYAAGEVWRGAGQGAKSALVVAVGTGVGGAVVIDGAVYHGQHFLAGEMGHMPCQDAAEETCTCGKNGHLEAIAAGPQIARRYRQATGSAVTTALEVEQRAEQGDEKALLIYSQAAVALGRAIAQIVTVLDPACVIVSGGLARSGQLWWQPLRETVKTELLDFISGSTQLVPAALGAGAPIVGAAHEASMRLQL